MSPPHSSDVAPGDEHRFSPQLVEPGYRPALRAPTLPAALTLFPLSRWLHARAYRGRLEDHEVFRRLVESAAHPSAVALDIGAGRGAPPAIRLRGRVRRVIGVDVAPEVLENPNLDEAHVGPASHMPFLTDGSVDFAFARYVAEHLADPVATLREVRRVLRPGGSFLFITPNRRHYVPMLASRLGHRAHQAVNALRGRPAEDTFPTVYALNTPEDVRRHAQEAGFERAEIALFESQPNYLTLHAALFAAGVVYERVVNRVERLAAARGSLLVQLET